MPHTTVFMINCAAFGICLFVATSAVSRIRHRPVVGWLIAFFVAHLLGLSVALGQALNSDAYTTIVLIALPALLLYSPCLFFYVSGLTGGPTPKRQDLTRHFAPSLAIAMVSLVILMAPPESRQWIGPHSVTSISGLGQVFRVTLLSAMLGFIAQALYYAWRIYQHLSQHRSRLKDVFTSTEEKELRWASAVSVLLVAYAIQTPWPVLANAVLGQHLDISALDAGLSLTLIWTLGLWGLRQPPVLPIAQASGEVGTGRYSKSTLPPEAMVRIAQKIERVVKTEKQYGNADFSLSDLADATGVSNNHLSQTLNTQIGERFFDYVNHHRIEAAQELLLDSEQGIAEVLYAVGFNSRSAFYRAFRRETNASPAQWRKDAKA